MQISSALILHGCESSCEAARLFAAILVGGVPCLERVLPHRNAPCDRRGVVYRYEVRAHLQDPVTVHAVLKIGQGSTWQGLVLRGADLRSTQGGNRAFIVLPDSQQARTFL